jgi:O-antigen ligase
MALVVATAVGSITLASTGSIGFLRQRAHLQSYDIHRFSGQEQGVELILNHPLGIGPGQFEQTVGIAAHSTYVRALAEQGALGLATMLGLMLGTLGLATQNAILGRDTFGIGSAPLLAAWCGLLANSAFVDTLHWRHFWLVAGLVWAGAMRADYQAARAP